jgi:hypothetical protein
MPSMNVSSLGVMGKTNLDLAVCEGTGAIIAICGKVKAKSETAHAGKV